ncbi:MAG: MFS transporter [Clostridiales Family XIII bacterium]|jgi:predicted MFS family arabinose efflux permease|nr:MFS transporter [Clostridiales Family XIII bacterium]
MNDTRIPTNAEFNQNRAMFLCVLSAAVVGFALGLSDSILANFFREAYGVGAQQRGLIEFPRELPGIVATFVIAALSFLRNVRTAIVAQCLCAVGMLILGLFRPSFFLMCIFIFIYSLGQHMYIPLGDSIGLSLSKQENMGRVLGKLNSVRMAFLMVAGVITFFGFRFGFFDFETPVLVFLLSAICFIIIAILNGMLTRHLPEAVQKKEERPKLVFRREYLRYYMICALYGGRKQIMLVFSPWVLIELLDFHADTISILAVIGSFIGIFFIPLVGKLIDRFGVRRIMIAEALAFISVYVAYGFLSKWITENVVILTGFSMMMVYLLNIIDRMSAQFYMVRSIYMRSIAITPEDVTPSLSLGMAIDHVVAIVGAFLCGTVWEIWGPEYVFLIAGILSLLNGLVAAGIKKQNID